MNLGEKILKLRKERGLSQEDLAEKLGTTRQAISKWENNQGFPDASIAHSSFPSCTKDSY